MCVYMFLMVEAGFVNSFDPRKSAQKSTPKEDWLEWLTEGGLARMAVLRYSHHPVGWLHFFAGRYVYIHTN
jgi:hypothetical protein